VGNHSVVEYTWAQWWKPNGLLTKCCHVTPHRTGEYITAADFIGDDPGKTTTIARSGGGRSS